MCHFGSIKHGIMTKEENEQMNILESTSTFIRVA